MRVCKVKIAIAFLAVVGTLLLSAFSTPQAFAQDLKFKVVAGQGENAYLVNTKTGQVWILTYRTLATGREPVAIPYKFLMKRPNQEGFLTDEHNVPRLSPAKP